MTGELRSEQLGFLLRRLAGRDLQSQIGDALTDQIGGHWEFLELGRSDTERAAISRRISEIRETEKFVVHLAESADRAMSIVSDLVAEWPRQHDPMVISFSQAGMVGLLQMQPSRFVVALRTLFRISDEALIAVSNTSSHGVILHSICDFSEAVEYEVTSWEPPDSENDGQRCR